jgi:hypothetical protein
MPHARHRHAVRGCAELLRRAREALRPAARLPPAPAGRHSVRPPDARSDEVVSRARQGRLRSTASLRGQPELEARPLEGRPNVGLTRPPIDELRTGDRDGRQQPGLRRDVVDHGILLTGFACGDGFVRHREGRGRSSEEKVAPGGAESLVAAAMRDQRDVIMVPAGGAGNRLLVRGRIGLWCQVAPSARTRSARVVRLAKGSETGAVLSGRAEAQGRP